MKLPLQILRIVASISIAAILPLIQAPSTAYAFTLSDGIKEFNLNPGELNLGSVEFTNTESKNIEIKVEAKAYDPKSETFITTSPFLGVKKSRYTVKAGETTEIDYAVTIPQDQPAGSFFNVLTVEPTTGISNNDSVSVSIRNGFGVLFAFHITTPDTSIDKIFIENSDTKLIVEHKGLPYLTPMKIKYVYENKSNFVFKPQGEIRLLDNQGKQVTERFTINEEAKTIYPGEKLEISKEINTWKDLREVMESKLLISRTYNGYTENYITNQVEVSIKEPVIMAGVLALLLLLGVLNGIIAVIKKIRNSGSKSQE